TEARAVATVIAPYAPSTAIADQPPRSPSRGRDLPLRATCERLLAEPSGRIGRGIDAGRFTRHDLRKQFPARRCARETGMSVTETGIKAGASAEAPDNRMAVRRGGPVHHPVNRLVERKAGKQPLRLQDQVFSAAKRRRRIKPRDLNRAGDSQA